MPDVRRLAAAYGVRIERADLGDWGAATLVAEYDPEGPTIRVDLAVAGGAVDAAIAHELYHHREAIGEAPRLRGRAARERAADDFAAALLGAGSSR